MVPGLTRAYQTFQLVLSFAKAKAADSVCVPTDPRRARPIGAVAFMQRGNLKMCLRSTDGATDTAEVAKVRPRAATLLLERIIIIQCLKLGLCSHPFFAFLGLRWGWAIRLQLLHHKDGRVRPLDSPESAMNSRRYSTPRISVDLPRCLILGLMNIRVRMNIRRTSEVLGSALTLDRYRMHVLHFTRWITGRSDADRRSRCLTAQLELSCSLGTSKTATGERMM